MESMPGAGGVEEVAEDGPGMTKTARPTSIKVGANIVAEKVEGGAIAGACQPTTKRKIWFVVDHKDMGVLAPDLETGGFEVCGHHVGDVWAIIMV